MSAYYACWEFRFSAGEMISLTYLFPEGKAYVPKNMLCDCYVLHIGAGLVCRSELAVF